MGPASSEPRKSWHGKDGDRKGDRDEEKGGGRGGKGGRTQPAELLFAKGGRRTAGKTPQSKGELLLTANMAANLARALGPA